MTILPPKEISKLIDSHNIYCSDPGDCVVLYSREHIHHMLAKATYYIVFELARILLKHGIGFRIFEEWVKKAFLDAAEMELKDQQLKVTTSSLSTLTNITRKETKRIRDVESVEAMTSNEPNYNRAARVISGWCTDTDFLDDQNEPAILSVNDKEGHSFFDLVRKYGGDITPKPMLDQLISAGNVQRENDQVQLVKKAYVPCGEDYTSESINILAWEASSLINTIAHNMESDFDNHFQRKLYNHSLKAEYFEEFKKYSAEKSQLLLEELNHWISTRKRKERNEPVKYISLSIFFSDHYPAKKQ